MSEHIIAYYRFQAERRDLAFDVERVAMFCNLYVQECWRHA